MIHDNAPIPIIIATKCLFSSSFSTESGVISSSKDDVDGAAGNPSVVKNNDVIGNLSIGDNESEILI
eukprot:CAMPEP_0201578008 /NCGR_PEP_ID=MMETSP0190_2-20130828/24635_1 /ASSEMBLY_ACC=CAM_ASM_000263 /TAXON_ID=37353 /ORGANISM="Rosalina sp." /LENGTH=66 /DNA_ID=CAMNT_0048010669 /DNA_START=394 /DNA_END=591 /DNA_ORIENTATION=-